MTIKSLHDERIEAEENEAMPSLTARQTIALNAILAGQSFVEAASKANVHRNTVANWFYRNYSFQAHFCVAQRVRTGQTIRAVQNQALASVKFLSELRDNEYASNPERLRAASLLLKHAINTNTTFSNPDSHQLKFMQQAHSVYNLEALTDLETHLTFGRLIFPRDEKLASINSLRAELETLNSHATKTKHVMTDASQDEISKLTEDLSATEDAIAQIKGKLAYQEIEFQEHEIQLQNVQIQRQHENIDECSLAEESV